MGPTTPAVHVLARLSLSRLRWLFDAAALLVPCRALALTSPRSQVPCRARASHLALTLRLAPGLRLALALTLALTLTLALALTLTLARCPADHVLRMHYLAGAMPQKLQALPPVP
jgi:hypothetical protein